MLVRNATPADLADCQAIYGFHVLHGTGSFETAPPPLEVLQQRHRAITAAGHPWLVAEDTAGIQGFGYYGPFRERPAYLFTAEDSLYIRDSARGRGVGKALLAALLAHATSNGIRQMLALIGDAENTASIAVHASLGFQHIGVMRHVGHKFDRWLDVVTMQKALAPGAE